MGKSKGKGGKGKSKSKKGKKGKQLSDEEKAKQTEMKALAEKEKLVRRTRLTQAFLKLKKEKEYALLKLNENKLLDLWRPRLRKLKCDELMEDYKLLQAAFERNLMKKDDLLEELENMMRNGDEEYDNAFDMHLHSLDQLMEWFRNRLTQVREMYGTQRTKLMNVLNEEKLRMTSYQDKSLGYLNGVMAAVNMRYRELASDSKAELFIRQEEIRNKAMEETHAVKTATDKKMRAVWDELQILLLDYDKKIAPLRIEFQGMSGKDDGVVSEIDSQFKKMFKLQVGIENLAEKERMYCEKLQTLMTDLNAKREDLKQKYKLEAQRFDFWSKLGRENIRYLALVSGGVLETMDEMITQRERLLRSIERCRKRERLDEKVDPFMKRWGLHELASTGQEDEDNPSSMFGNVPSSNELEDFDFVPPKIEHVMTCDCNPCTCALNEDHSGVNPYMFSPMKSVTDFALLDRFWIRFNRAALENRLLRRRRYCMQEDNHQLKLALRNYMGGMNPLQHNVETYSDELMVIPSSPVPLSPNSFPSSDSDYGSDESVLGGHPRVKVNVKVKPTPSQSPNFQLPSILKSPKVKVALDPSASQKEVRFPQRYKNISDLIRGKNLEKAKHALVPVIDGAQVVRLLERI